MTPEQELADEYMNVSVTIKVSGSEVEKTLTGITVTGQPSKTEYEVGDKFDPSGIEITASYSNGDTEVLGADAEGLAFSPEEFTEAGAQTVTVLYTVGDITRTASVNVTVSEKPEEPAVLTGIEVTTEPAKTEYEVGDAFDPSGMVVTASYDRKDSQEIDLDKLTFTPEVFDKAGEQTVTVSYTEDGVTKEAELQVTVTEKTVAPEVVLESIKVTPPQKLEYTAGEKLDTTGMTVTAVYSNGDEKDVTEEAVLTGYDKDLEGAQTIEVSYTEKDVTVKASFEVTVAADGTDEPGTDEPGTDEPGTDEPGTDEPGTDEPGTDEPGTDEPGTDKPGTDKPGSDDQGQKPADPGQQTPDASQPSADDDAAVQTGDMTNIAPMAAVCILALGCGAAAVVLKRKKRG